AVDRGDVIDQGCEGDGAPVEGLAPIGVDVLSEEVDLAYALGGEAHDFRHDVVERPADLLATRVRNDAERAVLAAASHDRNKGSRSFGTRFRQAVEFFNLREGDVDNRAAAGDDFLQHIGQAVQGLRPEYEVDVRCPAADALAFLAGNAPAHADHDAGPFLLERTPAPEFGKDLLLCLLPDRAGVDEQEIRILGHRRQFIAV